MNFEIAIQPKAVQSGAFNYANIQSRYGVNTHFFTRDGKPYTFVAGELHFSRVPRARWKSTLLKMRDCGINTVSTYVFWNYHNEIKGQFDFTGDRDIAAFLALCREIEMPCILRIGPWCHGEVIRGGFPKRIHHMAVKRTNARKYLDEVRAYWSGLYREVAPYLDGETVIGIQLENEYTGKTEHIRTLRRIAEEIGFQTPFFTMTAWPSGVPDRDFLPMMGGYPDAPWARGKSALKPNNRFAISAAKTEDEIGADLHQNKTVNERVYDRIPYASCEIGPGNQVTQHRRPSISEKDGYGVGFAKFASGMNWLGYYMFCGGRNPNDRLLQENRLTGYPNNYPIIDYDFQAPISRYGVCRPHGDRLRLLHLFIREFEPEICTKQAFFPDWPSHDSADTSFLKCSVRADEKGGYFFASAYEKGLAYRDFTNVSVRLKYGRQTVSLPAINVRAGSMFFYPFQIALGGIEFDYILAQPIAKLREQEETVCYFAAIEGVAPCCKTDGGVIPLAIGLEGNLIRRQGKRMKFIVLSEAQAKQLHIIGGRAVFAKGTVYADGAQIFCESTGGYLQDLEIPENDITEEGRLLPCKKKRLPYNHFLYSTGRRRYYELKLQRDILKGRFDVELEFRFTGLNLQVFSGNTLINDFFNIDGVFVMRLRDYETYLEKNPTLTIRTAPKTRLGVSHVYHETPIPMEENALSLIKIREVKRAVQSYYSSNESG